MEKDTLVSSYPLFGLQIQIAKVFVDFQTGLIVVDYSSYSYQMENIHCPTPGTPLASLSELWY